MAKKSVDLRYQTPAQWVDAALADTAHLLADHANCERKASAMAMSMVVRFADREKIIPPLIDLAIEELDHFRQCHRLMQQRGIAMIPDHRDPYIHALTRHQRHGRDEHFLDQLLIFSLVECRGAERFRLIAQSERADAELRQFYKSLWAAEARHGNLFAELALCYFDENAVYTRLHELAEIEGRIVAELPWRSALH